MEPSFIHKPPVAEELRARLRAAVSVTTMQRELIRYATTDPLTKLLNRRAFFDDAANLCQTAGSDAYRLRPFYSTSTISRASTTRMVTTWVMPCWHGWLPQRKGHLAVWLADWAARSFVLLEHRDMASAIELAETVRGTLKALSLPNQMTGDVTCSFGVRRVAAR